LAESDDAGNTLTEYVWFDDMPIALVANVDTSPSLYFVHTDHLDRPIMMTDANKAIVWQADYNPFGGVNSITGSATNNLRFPGQYFLMEDGLHYNWYRHYDPTIGRYIQPDPLGFINGPSLYTYVRNDPIGFYDPYGLWTVQMGFSFSYTFGNGFTVGGTIGVAYDGQGNLGGYGSWGYGAGAPGGGFAGIQFAGSDADTICQLGGPFRQISGGGGIDGVGATVDHFWGNSDQGPVSGWGVTVGTVSPIAGSATTTVTTVKPF
jgi:RHS repeat-associated protein